MSETDIVNTIRGELFSRFPDARLFRNNNGRLQDVTGGYVTYGLGVGTSDLIGFHPLLIEPRHVGLPLAQFVAIEVKKPGEKPRNADSRERWAKQLSFCNHVVKAGGLAGFARSLEEACDILNHR